MELPEIKNAIINEWARRVVAEYNSASLSSHLLHWMIQLGVSPDLLYSCNAIVRDELMHSDLSMNVFIEAGGNQQNIKMDDKQLRINYPSSVPLIDRTMLFLGEMFCVGETIAVPLFKKMNEGSEVKIVKNTLKQIISDEKRHSEFGWESLNWMVENFPSSNIPWLKANIAKSIQSRLAVPCITSEIENAKRSWGLISDYEYHEIMKISVSKTIVPNLKEIFGQFDETSPS